MKKQTIIIFGLLVVIICGFSLFIYHDFSSAYDRVTGRESDWEKIKKTKTIYPKDTFSVFKNSILQDTEFVWVNESYKNYPYKKNCKNGVQASFDMADLLAKVYFEEDSLSIAHLLLNELRKTGISHFVGQTLDNNKLSIYYYTEDCVNEIGTDFIINYTGELQSDEEWKAFGNLLALEENKIKY